MIQIISGTNRPGSNSLRISKIVEQRFKKLNAPCEIMPLCEFPFNELDGSQYSKDQPAKLVELKAKIDSSSGIFVVCPEYNGSMPGILKYFIDHWSYPESFLSRPVAFIGLGGMFGGLRPVEHLQQVFGYRNAYIFPERVFLMNVWSLLNDKGEITDEKTNQHLDSQTENFVRFIKALEQSNLHANTKG